MCKGGRKVNHLNAVCKNAEAKQKAVPEVEQTTETNELAYKAYIFQF